MKKDIDAEIKRRRVFAKAAKALTDVWPGYAAAAASLTIECETDRFNLERCSNALDALKTIWPAARAGQATPEQFEKACMDWSVCYRLAFGCFELKLRRIAK